MTTSHYAPDAYQLEHSVTGDVEIVDRYDLDDYRPDEGWNMVDALELVRSINHGLRTAEGTAAELIAEAAYLIVRPLLIIAGCRDVDRVDVMGELFDVFGLDDDPTSGCTHARGDDLGESLFEAADYEVEPMLDDCGYLVETSSDCGMTWIYRPVAS